MEGEEGGGSSLFSPRRPWRRLFLNFPGKREERVQKKIGFGSVLVEEKRREIERWHWILLGRKLNLDVEISTELSCFS